MIIEMLSSRDKIDLARECLEISSEGLPYGKMLIVSFSVSAIFSIILNISFPLYSDLSPLLSIGIFVLSLMALYLIMSNDYNPLSIYSKYTIMISGNRLVLKFTSLNGFENHFIIPISKIGGFSIEEKMIKVRCGRDKEEIQGKVISILNKRGRRIIDFGFWLHEEDLRKLYEELVAQMYITVSKKSEKV